MTDGLRKGLASYGDAGFSLFLRKAFIKAMAIPTTRWIARSSGSPTPIATTTPATATCRKYWSGEARRHAVGRHAEVFPTISIAESFSHPTSMYVRNLMAMDTEEMIRAQPMDSVVVIAAATRPCRPRSCGRQCGSSDRRHSRRPMVVGHHRGEVLAPAPTAAASGRNTARARSTTSRSRRQRPARPRLGTCMVMAPPAPWPASPRRWVCRCR